MSKFALRFGAVFLTFIIGLASNFLINGVVERWIQTSEPVLEEPCATTLGELQRPMPPQRNCGLLVVEVGADRSLWLRGEWLGSLDNPRPLVARLTDVFGLRNQAPLYRVEFELNSQVPEEERIERIVLVRSNRSISYGEVSDLIEVIRATGAKPIGLVSEGVFAIGQNQAVPITATWLDR
jgi:hypothetical protein